MLSVSPHRYAVLAVVLAAVLMSVLDGIVVGIALPTITAFFATSVAVSQWTITVYLLILTALPSWGWGAPFFRARTARKS